MSKKVLGIHFLNFLRFFCFVLERLMGVMLRWRQNTPILCQPRSPRAPWGPPYSGGGSAQLTLTSVTAKGGLWDPGGGGEEVWTERQRPWSSSQGTGNMHGRCRGPIPDSFFVPKLSQLSWSCPPCPPHPTLAPPHTQTPITLLHPGWKVIGLLLGSLPD